MHRGPDPCAMRTASRLPRPRSIVCALVVACAVAAGLVPAGIGGTARAADFPPADARYHSYAEMVAEIHAVAAAHPDIVRVVSIGKSYEGRDIWAAKISDNVVRDEAEPEVVFDALHHAREHMTVEQALYLLHLLADGWGADVALTSIVKYREIWIVFALNPDGGEYDLTGPAGPRGPYRAWRKNRQPNAGSGYVGTDLNRNYDYRWGCCGGSSGVTSSITYRGPAPFSAPETRVMRDFINSRIVGGIQQITSHITFHTNGELILWPYGYTFTDVPIDMTSDDHQTFMTWARGQGARNGYTAQQSSQLYITDGDQIDWMYGRHRIFSFTWELYPPETATVWGDHYPADEQIAPQTARNRSALIYFLQVAACPYSVLGTATTKTHCGPFNDDFEGHRGWTVNAFGTDTATSGAWLRGDPVATSLGGRPKQLGTVTSGRYALTTGPTLNGTASANDVDGGTTTARSVAIVLPATVGALTFRWYFGTHYASTQDDSFRVYLEAADGDTTPLLVQLGTPAGVDAVWRTASVPLTPWAGQTVRFIVVATDGGPDNLVEAGIDDFRIQRP